MRMKTLAIAFAAALAMPMAATAVTVDINGSDATAASVVGTTQFFGPVAFTADPVGSGNFVSDIEIFGDNIDGAGQIVVTYIPDPSIKNLRVTGSLNQNPLATATLGRGFIDAEIEIRTGTDTDADGLFDSGDILTLFQPDVSGGVPLTLNDVITLGTPFQIIGRFSDVVGNGQNFDIRVAAVPLPASLAFLLAGIGGLGVMSRRARRA